MIEQFSFSPQVKRTVIISKKHDIYKLPHEMLNDLKNQKKSGKYLDFIQLLTGAQSSSRTKHFVRTSKNLLKNRKTVLILEVLRSYRLATLSFF